MKTFPLFIKSESKSAVIIGGGKIALRRIFALIPFGFEITVIAPQILPEIESIGAQIKIIHDNYASKYIENAYIIIAATNMREINHAIYNDAKARGILISVADNEAECSFYFPAIAQNNVITVGITGNGQNHSEVKCTAAKIRKVLQNEKDN